MMLPPKGALPFKGSLITPPVILDAGTAEKFPLKNAAGIDVDSDVACCTNRYPSYDAMKNVLSRPLYSFGISTGPSNSTPNWFWRSGGFAAVGLAGVGKVKKLLASKT